MTGPEAIDLERISRVFADLDDAGKVAMAGEIADQLERTWRYVVRKHPCSLKCVFVRHHDSHADALAAAVKLADGLPLLGAKLTTAWCAVMTETKINPASHQFVRLLKSYPLGVRVRWNAWRGVRHKRLMDRHRGHMIRYRHRIAEDQRVLETLLNDR